MTVLISAEAEEDIERIGDFIARENPGRAESFTDELLKACLELAEFPYRFPAALPGRSTRLRRRIHGDYLIFYHVNDGSVTVLHVLHAKSDYGAII